MIISAVDQLVCVDEADSYASSMGMTFPADGVNAQYYKMNGSKVTEVSPEFFYTSAQSNRILVYFPQIFSAVANSYYTPDANDVFTFRINSMTGDATIIAQGTLSTFALVNGSRVWNTTGQGATAQTYSQVFMATTATYNNITVPAIAIRGQVAYGTQKDLAIYCTVEFDGGSITTKGEMEIRSMESDVYKAAISATSSAGGNDQVIDTSNETITLTGILTKNGSTSGISGATYNWHKHGSVTSLGTNSTLVVTESMVDGHAIFCVDITYGGTTYTASITINDIQDRYAIIKGRTVYSDSSKTTEVENTNVIKKSYLVLYQPSVIDTQTDTTSSGWSFTYTLKDNAGNVIGTPGSDVPSGGLEVPGNTVKTNGGINVHLTATNSNL